MAANQSHAAPGRKPIPVTMLSGFLGAGKTTLLRYLLENSTLKIGCIVNDVAAVNIDAKLIRNDRNRDRGATNNTTSDLADTIELANGCACCSIQDELFASFQQLLDMADKRGSTYDRFVLENSGVAEPQNIRDKFNEAIAANHPLLSRIALDTLVTIVDSSTFITDWSSRTPLAARPDLGEGGNLRPVVDLLVEQIECADFLLLNKTDLLESDKLGSLTSIVSSLNPLAQVISCSQGRINIEQVFGKQHAGHEHAHGHTPGHASGKGQGVVGCAHHHHHKRQETTAAARFGIRSFVYLRRRPFHPQRLKEMVLKWLPVTQNMALGDTAPDLGASPIKSVLRSKGFMWMSHSHATAFYWSHAGQHFEIRDEGDWWAGVPDEDWPEAGPQREVILADFDPTGPYGDRRQEIVFIGAQMDQAAICNQLDTALLTDDEMQKYADNYRKTPDPAHA
ncbi:hypothetical protein WJX72_002032 [[Myrmecia] bisecta]|uniref:CobW C-terminal domain-containing protein n=1 Tax=[Myrmecia] bisecta TaxID=41462 RepID=A0AAW1QEB0_9CHLO